MTIDERVDRVVSSLSLSTLKTLDVEVFRELLRKDFLEVARDQRHACAEALTEIDRNAWSLDAAMGAVMNAQKSGEGTSRKVA